MCLKDDFLRAIIELFMDATIGFNAFSFMDCFSGYNQIQMEPKYEELIAFWTPQGKDSYTITVWFEKWQEKYQSHDNYFS